ncbi:hypothetical protein XU18_3782 [Perkinsela sp. CCAP 1560/4]|nr:hypothetical protein XU18_3782 [Perkinsela sp. CCAP 1560/4]|eukprot:KNH05134.1 hypothetical protein XU18_3782 [Perkinsela sp. CCAP 1560/4]
MPAIIVPNKQTCDLSLNILSADLMKGHLFVENHQFTSHFAGVLHWSVHSVSRLTWKQLSRSAYSRIYRGFPSFQEGHQTCVGPLTNLIICLLFAYSHSQCLHHWLFHVTTALVDSRNQNSHSKAFWGFSHSDSMKSKHPVFVNRLFVPLNQEVAIKYFKRVVCAVFFRRAHERR